jgi:hypothetical protein
MTMSIQRTTLVALLLLTLPQALAGQQPPPGDATKPGSAAAVTKLPPVGVKVQLVLSRYQGEKRLTNVPYSLALTSQPPGNSTRLRANADVPYLMTKAAATADGKQSEAPASYSYRTVGTQIDCSVLAIDETHFRLEVAVADSFMVANPGATNASPAPPVFRSFTGNGTVFLKDGQTSQITSATDPISGEVMKIDVTLSVAK